MLRFVRENVITGIERRARARVTRHRVAVFLPVIVLCGVATLQSYDVRAHHLSPWKGGGFGMFSTVDSVRARFIRARVRVDGRELPVALPRALRPIARSVRAMPQPDRLASLARDLMEAPWVELVTSERGDTVLRPIPTSRRLPAGAVRVEPESAHVDVYRYGFDAEANALYASLLVSHTVERSERSER